MRKAITITKIYKSTKYLPCSAVFITIDPSFFVIIITDYSVLK